MTAIATQERAEIDRVAALDACSILGTPPEESFDFIARLAADVCGAAMAGITFVDSERQVYKAAIGMQAVEVKRDDSFCAHAVTSGASIVVEDARADERFRDSPLVTGRPGIRFYAGVPVRSRGEALGALCVMDAKPRAIEPHQLELLEGLANQAGALVEQRRDKAEMDLFRRRVDRDEHLAHVAAWEWDTATDKATWTPELRSLLGVGDDVEGSFENFLALVHEDERELVGKTIAAVVDMGGRFNRRTRIVRPDGAERTIDTQGEVYLDDEGKTLGMWGATVDVTDLVEAERSAREQTQGLAAAFETAQNAILVTNNDRRYVQVNQLACDLLGYSAEEMLELHVEDLVPKAEADEPSRGSLWESFVDTGHQAGEIAVLKADGSRAMVEYSATANFVPGLHLTILKDVTLRRAAEQEALESRQRLEETQALAGVASWEWDLASEFQEMPDEVAEVMGAGTQERRPSYEDFVDLVHPDDKAEFAEVVAESLRTAKPFRQIFRVVTEAGEVRTIESHGRVKADESGTPTSLLGAVQDITVRERAAHELRLQANVLDQVPAGVIASSRDRKITHWSHGAEVMFGIGAEAAVGKTFDELGLIPPESEGIRDAMVTKLGRGEAWEGEITSQDRSGRQFVSLLTNSPVRDEQNEISGYVAVVVDLTERRTIERQVDIQEHLLDEVEAGVIAMDLDRRVIHWNRGAEKLLGWSREEATDRVVSELELVAGDDSFYQRSVEAQLRTGSSWEAELELRRKDGTTFPAYATNSTVTDPDGGPTGYVGVLVDITEQKRAEEAAMAARLGTIRRLAIAVEKRDPETGGHIERIGDFAAKIAERLGETAERVELIRVSGTMHDVGKIGIADDILLKPGKLNSEERAVMQTHAAIGHDILAGTDADLNLAATIALTHHERVDGTGYPQGLSGTEIPLEGRIVAVADVFDALTSNRVYRKAFSVEKAIEMMEEGRGTHFDPALLDLLLEVLEASGAISQCPDA